MAPPLILTTPAALHAWLRSATNDPFFSKPCASGFARAAMLTHRYEPAGDCLARHDGTRLRIDECGAHFQDLAHLGYLFQSPIQPHAQLLPSLGPIITSLRMMILYDEQQGPIVHRAFWKLRPRFRTGCGPGLASAALSAGGHCLVRPRPSGSGGQSIRNRWC